VLGSFTLFAQNLMGQYPAPVDAVALLPQPAFPSAPRLDQAVFAPDQQPEPPFPSWYPEYPGHVLAEIISASAQRAYFAPDQQPEPPREGWDAEYPDVLGASTPVIPPSFFAPDRQPEPSFALWAPIPGEEDDR
jgi:hypothetical protein